MKERPVLFSAPMVRAILAGTKTQTRRTCKFRVYPNGFHFDGRDILCHNDYLPPSAMLMDVKRGRIEYTTSDIEDWESECPYGSPGGLLWVRETFQYESRTDDFEWDVKKRRIVYRATEPDAGPWMDSDDNISDAWRPSIHMPRWASRITLRITDVRVERLQDISEADAMAEGVPFTDLPQGRSKPDPLHGAQFADLWESINGPDSWDANPWVWVIEFERIEQAREAA